MICPHCLVGFHEVAKNEWNMNEAIAGVQHDYNVLGDTCSECNRRILRLHTRVHKANPPSVKTEYIVPREAARTPLSDLVPGELASDYREACAVLEASAKASAALSRRCLQHVIRQYAGIKKGNLKKEIDALIESHGIPPYISEDLHALRELGNFAAHPSKGENPAEIVNVEDGEAEWCLEILEKLFDFFFVQKADSVKRRSDFEKKYGKKLQLRSDGSEESD